MRKSKYTEDAVRTALEKKIGNITHAAAYLGMTKTHAMRLVRKMGFRNYAHEIRMSAGRASTGKPPAH